MEAATQVFAEQGLLGAIIIVMGWAYWRKDAALQVASKEMVDLAKQVTEAVIALKSFGGGNGQ